LELYFYILKKNPLMKKLVLGLFCFSGLIAHSQQKPIIEKKEVVRIETELASDKMQGRAMFSSGITMASAFIESEFKKIGLDYYNGLKNYRQEFEIKGKKANNVIGILKGK